MLKEALFPTLEKALGKRYSIVSSYVFDKNTIAFFAVRPYKDNWNSYLKLIIFRPDGQWYAAELNGIWGKPWFGGIIKHPRHQLLFVSENGDTHTAVGGYPLTSQGAIPKSRSALKTSDFPALFFHNAKSINGKIYTVNSMRGVFKFTGSEWIQLKSGLPDYEDIVGRNYGFRDIDGFSEDDIYAAGGDGDLWHWNGEKWRQIDCPTNALLTNICCGDDGLVYITMNKNAILCGREDNWEFINQDMSDRFESIVWFKDRIYLSSSYQLFQIKDNKFSAANEGEFRSLLWGRLSVGDGIMVAALDRRIGIYDGKEWTIVSEGKKVPWQQD
ncbi:MAG: hypothetical protein L3J51_05770 [Cocleimonas sp.]|nr:hypothetical protein [Cocleimonas sp.]